MEANKAVNAEIREKYPKAHFLSPDVSNRQIISEGVDALFTVHGTAGHEFAYCGVPVVNAGDNTHIGYSFNFHAQTVAEYEQFIRNAGSLKIDIRKDDIAEFVYMNYFYTQEHRSSPVNPIPAAYFETAEYNDLKPRPEGLEIFMQPRSDEEMSKLEEYLDREIG